MLTNIQSQSIGNINLEVDFWKHSLTYIGKQHMNFAILFLSNEFLSSYSQPKFLFECVPQTFVDI